MKIKRFNNFLLESQLVYKGDFKKILNEIKNEYWNQSEAEIAEFLLSLSGMELDLVHNYIKDVTTAGLVSFIPEDKLDFNKVSIEKDRIVTKTNIVNAYGIPTEGLIIGQDILDIGTDDFPNDFKLIKTVDCDIEPLSNEKLRLYGYYLYYLQSNTYPEKFVVVFRSANDEEETPSIYLYNIPENRRSDVKLGRFVNKIIDIYNKSGLESTQKFTAAGIEKFINVYTSKILFNQDAVQRFEVVKGEEIRKWYHETNYTKIGNNGGPLHNSCMRFSRCQNYFDIYVDNPDVCQLLILKDSTGKKIDGRALLWTTVDGKKFMDRIYVSKDSYSNLFKKWAEQNKYTNTGYGYGQGPGRIIIQVKPKLYSTYPYMDTLVNYLPDKGLLTNNIDVNMLQNYPDIRKETRVQSFKNIFKRKNTQGRYKDTNTGKSITIYRLGSTTGQVRRFLKRGHKTSF